MSKDVRVNITTDGDPKGAIQVALSIDQLEERVKSLETQLSAAPVGGKQFIALAENVRVARKELSDAQGQATKLAGTIGRQGNAGMAVLEFSRAFEDAQYGIRGVLNNIPGLIAMLGGGAGLAGVISLAAVLGTQLWEKLGGGAEAAKTPLEKYKETLEKTKQVFEEIERISQNQRDEASKDADRTTNRALNQLDMGSWFQDQQASLEKLRIQSEGRIAIAKQELEIAKIDAELKTKSGTEALKLTERRRAEVEKIYEIEKKNAEQLRQLDIDAAKREVAAAQKKVDVAGEEFGTKAGTQRTVKDSIYSLETSQDNLLRQKIELEKQLVDALKARKDAEAAAAKRSAADPSNPFIIEPGKEDPAVRAAILNYQDLSKRLKETSESLGSLESEISTQRPGLEKSTQEMIAASDRYNKALDERTKMLDSLNSLENRQGIERNEEAAKASIREEKTGIENDGRIREAGQQAASNISQTLEQIFSDIGNAANTPAVQTLAGQLRDILKDGFQKNEQGEVVQILQSIISRGNLSGEAQRKVFQAMLDTVEKSLSLIQEVSGQVKNLDTKVNTIGGQVRQNSVSPNY